MSNYTNHFISHTLTLISAILIGMPACFGLPLTKYAEKSKLAEGTWKTIKIQEEGMQFLSYQQLRNMGFSSPEKVRVYGYGGRKVKEELSEKRYIDDLPMQPSITTENGILFFGTNSRTWKTHVLNERGNLTYHYYLPMQNPYNDESIYFLSDCEYPDKEIEVRDGRVTNSSDKIIDWFYERVLHEQDLQPAGNSSSWLVGEDFRQQRTRNFSFKLPGLIGPRAYISTLFGTRSSLGTKVKVKANGVALSNIALGSDSISSCSSAEDFMKMAYINGTATNASENLDVEITFVPNGVVTLANLDYIVVKYQRELNLENLNALHFYKNFKDSTNNFAFKINGCTSATKIWDVTNPENPFEIRYILDGTTAYFKSPEGDGREFIAFDPTKITTSPTFAGTITNQNIHGMEVPDMVIITPELYLAQAERVANWHREADKMTVHVVTPEVLYNEFSSGNPDVSAFRKALKMWYDRGLNNGESKLQHCLLFGRPTYDQKKKSDRVKNCGYPRPLIWQSPEFTLSGAIPSWTTSQIDTYCCDDYIAMLQDNTLEKDVDMSSANVSIGVGRLPVRYITDCKQAVDKLLSFLQNPGTGFWRNRAMLIADDGNSAVHLTQNESSLQNMRGTNKGADILYEKLYIDAYPALMTGTGTTFPEAKERMLKMWNDGVMYTQYVGHANPKEWTSEALLTFTDINSFTNKNLSVFYTPTCEFSRIDDDEVSGGEIIWATPDAGAIAMFSTTRTVYIANNGSLTDGLAKYMFASDKNGNGLPLGKILAEGKNTCGDASTNKRRYVLLGDPAMRMPITRLSIKTETINGVNINDDPDDPALNDILKAATLFRYPVLNARSQVKVTGIITDPNGECISDFNGSLEYELYDGESVKTTFGQSDAGRTQDYNDRSNRLFVGNCKVVNGKWEATLIIPADIQNLTTAPFLVMYACSNSGVEATGHSSEFYINGWNEENQDFDGPEITSLVLNNPSFKNGDPVSSKPIVFGEMTDPNGISIASYGIGRRINLTLDGSKIFDDVDVYYKVKENDIYTGSFVYPLPELETGKHNLELNVWDNMGNLSSKTIDFLVAVSPKPIIYNVTTDANPARSSVTFTVNHDRIQELTEMRVDVFDLTGRKIWSSGINSNGNFSAPTAVTWDLTCGGARVSRGIYLYRATLTTQDGISVSRTNKLAVAAE